MNNFFSQMNDAFQQNPTTFIVIVIVFTLLAIMVHEYKNIKNNQVSRMVSTRIGKQGKLEKFDVVAMLLKLFSKREEKAELLLKRANVLFTTKEYMTFMSVGFIAGVLIGLIASPLGVVFKVIIPSNSAMTQEIISRILNAVVLGYAGSYFPRAWLQWLIIRRRKLLNEQIMDALLNIADALKSGHVINKAIQIVGDEMPYPIGPEFAKAYREMETGKSLESALIDLKKRIDLPDFTMAINAIEIQYEVGGKLEPLLRNMVTIINDRAELKKEIEKTIAGSKTVGYVLLAAPWFFILVFTSLDKSTYIQMLASPLGLILLLVALICYVIAAVIIIYIIRDVSKDAE